MKLSDFDFELPKELIAQTPAAARDASRLMIVNRADRAIAHDSFANLPLYLRDHPLMVLNDTKVFPARLFGCRADRVKPFEILLVKQTSPDEWEVLIKGLNKLRVGTELRFAAEPLTALVTAKTEERAILRFGGTPDLRAALERLAKMPLPPYIRREMNSPLDSLDRERYQTVYAAAPGAIAAPTAGLHFTPQLLEKIRGGGRAEIAFLTLHVGPGTFQPVRVEDVASHRMESEYFRVPKETLAKLRHAKAAKQPVLAVGTTVTRALETLADSPAAMEDATGWSDRFIYPGYQFKIVTLLLTNFHLPRSTLYMLACAFGGKDLMRKAYSQAIQNQYRFFSYGDAMLIL